MIYNADLRHATDGFRFGNGISAPTNHMDTYFARHTEKLDVDEASREKLWIERKIAIHFPDDKYGNLRRRDNASLDVTDYPAKAKRSMNALTALAKNGGYVCAEYHQHDQCILGFVKPNSEVELFRARWGSRHMLDGREAILKSISLRKTRLVRPAESAAILVGRPRQGTIMRWRRIGTVIENLVERRRVTASLALLSPDQHELMCCEFLRTSRAKHFGLPKLLHLVLPIGRTMKGIDICGITETRKLLFAQVTYLQFSECASKLESLRQYIDPDLGEVILFCDTLEKAKIDGVTVFPLQRVYSEFASTSAGQFWLQQAVNPCFGSSASDL